MSMSFLQKLRFHIFPATPVILFGHPWIYLLLQVVLQASQTLKMLFYYWSFTCIDLNRISHYRRGRGWMSVAHISKWVRLIRWDGCDFCCFFGRLLGLAWPSIHLPHPSGLVVWQESLDSVGAKRGLGVEALFQAPAQAGRILLGSK